MVFVALNLNVFIDIASFWYFDAISAVYGL